MPGRPRYGSGVIIRQEQPDDREAIQNVHRAAFGGEVEPRLAANLMAAGDAVPELSLAAELDGVVVGHVVTSRATVADSAGSETPSLGLGPIGVLPEHQGEHIGSMLMHASIAAADALGYPMMILLGNPAYYSRFGFELASDYGIAPPDPNWAGAFQIRRLQNYSSQVTGTFSYAPAFDDE